MNDDELEAELDRAIADVSRRGSPKMLSHTVQIYAALVPDGYPRAWGSGVLLRIADTSFLLSCAHVYKAAGDGQALGIFGGRGEKIIDLASVNVHFTPDERFDIGVAELPPRIVEQLAPEATFLRLSDLDLQRPLSPGVYGILGYPQASTEIRIDRRVISPGPLLFTSSLHRGRIDGHIDDVTVSLTLDLGKTSDLDRNPTRMPHPKGMSGCGMWRLASIESPGNDAWTPDDIKLVGIQHMVTRTTATGSDISSFVQFIYDRFATLRPSIVLAR